MKINPSLAWHNLWGGFYWDIDKWRLYILPVPCIGLTLEFKRRCYSCRKKGYSDNNIYYFEGTYFCSECNLAENEKFDLYFYE